MASDNRGASYTEPQAFNEIIDRFEEAWQSGLPPEIAVFLPAAEPSRSDVLRELVHIDFEYRLKSGAMVRVERYLDLFAELRVDESLCLALIVEEFQFRRRAEADLSGEEYRLRFPCWADAITRSLESLPKLAGNPSRQRSPTAQLSCPYCHHELVIAAVSVDDEIVCPSCGSTLRLDLEQSLTWDKQRLPVIAEFKLLEVVGRGAFGTVYKAFDEKLQRTVAVKIPRSGVMTTDEDADRFVREARNAAQLKHPGIVTVYAVGRLDTFPYLVSEYVEGVTLAKHLTTRQFSPREGANLIREVALALQHAHEHGVIHRDLKPSNIMLTPAGVPRLMDFGLARRDAAEITLTLDGEILGTPAYMSPEQASGLAHRANASSDIYSLGVILFQLLTQELPFRGEVRMLLHQVIHDDPPSPRQLVRQIPRDLDTICLKCLSREPEQRYAIAGELADDLRRFLDGHPIVARPIGPVGRWWRWGRRNPAIATLTGVVCLLITSIAIGSTIGMFVIADQKRDAELARDTAKQASRAAVAARDLEAAQRLAAQESERRSRAVTELLVGVFESSDPLGIGETGVDVQKSGVKTPTVLELLGRSADRIQRDSSLDPLVKATLLESLGTVYCGIGSVAEAEPLLESALKLRVAAGLNLHHPDVLSVRCGRSLCSIINGRFTDAVEELRQILRLQKANGADTMAIARTQVLLGMALCEVDGPTEAEQLFRSALEIRSKLLGNEHHEVAINRALVVNSLLAQGKEKEALLESLQLAQSSPEKATPKMVSVLLKYEQIQHLRGHRRYDQAVAAYPVLLEEARQVVGPDHLFYAALLLDQAGTLHQQGDYLKAEVAAQAGLEICGKTAPNWPRLVEVYLPYAEDLAEGGNFVEAEKMYRRAMQGGWHKRVGNRPSGRRAAVSFIQWLRSQGRYAESAELARDLLKQEQIENQTQYGRASELLAEIDSDQGRLSKVRPLRQFQYTRHLASVYESNYEAFVIDTRQYASCLRDLGDFTTASRIGAETLSYIQKEMLTRQDLNQSLHYSLASFFADLGDSTSAEHHFRAGFNEARALAVPGHPLFSHHLTNLGMFLRNHGQPVEAEKLFEEALEICRTRLGQEHLATTESQLQLALTRQELNLAADAATLARDAHEARRTRLGSNDLRTQDSAIVLGQILARQNQSVEAEMLVRNALQSLQEQLPEPHPRVWQAHLDLGDLLIQQQDYAGAVEALETARDRLMHAFPARSWRIAEIESRLGACLSELRHSTQAESLLLASLQILESAWGGRHVRRRLALQRVIRHYEVFDNPTLAARYRERLAASGM